MGRPLALIGSLLALAWPAGARAAEPAEPLLAISGDSSGATHLARLDPVTLAPQGETPEVPEWHDGFSFSPGRTQIAFTISTGRPVNGEPGLGRGGIRIIDLATMRIVTDVQNGVAAEALAWLTPRRLIALNQGGGIVAANPLTGKVDFTAGRTSGACIDPPGKAVAPRALVVLLGNRLFRIDKLGRKSSVTLSGMSPECGRLGLALDTAANRVFVVGAGSRVVEIALRGMKVTNHAVGAYGRDRADETRALVLPSGRLIAVHRGSRGLPKGVELIDAAAGTRRTIDPQAGIARRAGSLVLTADGRAPDQSGASRGLRAFDLAGRPRFRMLTSRAVSEVQVAGPYAYARTGGKIRVIDLRARRVVHSTAVGAGTELTILTP